ncbi:Putative uncharacterized protein OS=uncultured Desulfobacterium sp. GN=N47_G32200 PE=4 SV=1 [Gemmata massiliana]|uniref:DUF3185 domain-containing protein n=1 Tax=Gemmata massiliana TaxID=1210884 RepID=A0A6P2D694_9BACT|nr:Putative uncharacterized protein OS=uncultured Desulfobacterium sp. GN=N47_G32200 PE=4 SV=1 [Gemmata massiliana]
MGEGAVRIVGIILVAIGALGLGWQGFSYVTIEKTEDGPNAVWREKERTVWVPPLVSGIAVVSGLILLASNGRREEM